MKSFTGWFFVAFDAPGPASGWRSGGISQPRRAGKKEGIPGQAGERAGRRQGPPPSRPLLPDVSAGRGSPRSRPLPSRPALAAERSGTQTTLAPLLPSLYRTGGWRPVGVPAETCPRPGTGGAISATASPATSASESWPRNPVSGGGGSGTSVVRSAPRSASRQPFEDPRPSDHVSRSQPVARLLADDHLRGGRTIPESGVLRGENGKYHHRYKLISAQRHQRRRASVRPNPRGLRSRLLLGGKALR